MERKHLELQAFWNARSIWKLKSQCRILLSEDPEDSLAILFLACAHYEVQEFEEADDCAKAAIALNYELPRAYILRGLIALRRDPKKASDYFEMAFKLDPSLSGLEYFSFFTGKKLSSTNRKELLTRLESEPENDKFLILLFYLYISQGNNQKALEYIQKYRGLKPIDAIAIGLEGQTLFNLGRYDEARELAMEGLRIEPNRPTLTNLASDCEFIKNPLNRPIYRIVQFVWGKEAFKRKFATISAIALLAMIPAALTSLLFNYHLPIFFFGSVVLLSLIPIGCRTILNRRYRRSTARQQIKIDEDF